MPTVSSIPSGSSVQDSAKAFRNADFLKIMLAEVTQQSPFDPQDSGKMVENIQKLQELANSTYQKFRDDIAWAQQLNGQTVVVQQQALTEAEARAQIDQGLRPDVGYGSRAGVVTSFRTVKEQVYVTVDGKDYPIDNVKQIVPQGGGELAEAAQVALGRQVGWIGANQQPRSGVVTAVRLDGQGRVVLRVGQEDVPFDQVRSIGMAPAA